MWPVQDDQVASDPRARQSESSAGSKRQATEKLVLCLARCCKDKGSLDSIPKHAQRRHDCVEPLIVSLQHKTDGNKKRGQTIAEFLDGKFLDGEGREQPSTEFSPRDDFQKAHGLPPRVKSTRAAQRAVQCGVTQEGNALVRIEVPDGAAEGDEFAHKSIDGSRTCKYRAPAGSGRRVLVAEEPRDNGEIAREFTGAKGAWEAVNGEHPRPIAQWQSGALLLMQNAKESCVDLYCAWRIESLKGLPDWLVQIVERSPIKVGNPVLERLCDLFGNESIKSFLCDHKLSSEEAGLVRLEDDEGITATLIVVRTTAPLKEAISDIDATGMYSYPALTADFVWKALLATRTLPPEGSEQRAAVQRTLAPADLGTSAGDLSLHPTALLYEEMWQRVAQDVNLMADDGTTVAEDLKRKWMERMVQSKVLDYLSTIGEPGCSSTAGGSGKCFLVTVEPAAATASTAAATSADAASAAAAPVVTPVTPTAAASESAPGTSDGQTTQPQIVPAAAGALVPAAKPAVADGTLVTTIKQRLETAVKDAPQEKKRQAQFDAVMTEMVNFDQFKVGNERRKYARDAYLADAEERGIDVREGYWGKSDKIPSDLECFEANGMTANPHGRDWWLAVGLAKLSSQAQPGPPRLDIVKAVKGDRKCVLMTAEGKRLVQKICASLSFEKAMLYRGEAASHAPRDPAKNRSLLNELFEFGVAVAHDPTTGINVPTSMGQMSDAKYSRWIKAVNEQLARAVDKQDEQLLRQVETFLREAGASSSTSSLAELEGDAQAMLTHPKWEPLMPSRQRDDDEETQRGGD